MTLGLGPELLERERELEQLDRAIEDVLAGEGRVVVIQGSPGIGKSRLLDALCARANGSARVLRGRGGELERDVPFAVVRELFEPVVVRASDAERSRLLAGAAGLAGPLLGVGSSEPGATDSAFAVMHGLYWLTANLAEDGPLVLALDDAHWTDEATQRWLAYLVPRIAELPVLLALAVRPREVDPGSRLARALASARDVVVAEPAALSEDGALQVVRDVLGEPDVRFSVAMRGATGGNPLLLRTLSSALAAADIAPIAANARRVQTVGIDRIGRIVLPRLHGLGREAVDLARAAAVLGEGRTIRDAASLAGLDPRMAVAVADELVKVEILRAGSIGFTHPVVRAAVSDELSAGVRAELHRAAAVSLRASGAGPEEVARHLLVSMPVGDPDVVATLRDAGRLALSRGAPEPAVEFLGRAVAEPPPVQDRAALLFELGSAAWTIHHPRAREWLEAAAEADDSSAAMRARLMVAMISGVTGWGWGFHALIAAIPQMDRELAVESNAWLLVVRWVSTKPLRLPRFPEDGEMPTGRTPAERMWLAASAHGALFGPGPVAEVVDRAERALSGGDLFGDHADNSIGGFAVTALGHTGAHQRARDILDEVAADAIRRGSLYTFEWSTATRGHVQTCLGNLNEAEADILTSLQAGSEHGWVTGQPYKLGVLVRILLERGEAARAEAELAERGLLSAATSPNLFGTGLLEARGRLHLAQGRAAEGLADLQECGERLAAIGSPWRSCARIPWRPSAALCLAALERWEEARALATEEVTDAREFGAAPWLGFALRVSGTVTGGDAGMGLLREAVEVLASSEARLEHAHALCDLGVLLRHQRRPAEARKPLRQALDLAERCGATALADRAAAELAAAGARPRRRAITGVDSLTPSERRVAVLAAQGKSNPEIAQSLFVTRKTVEKHLGNAFLKLQITARAELANALGMQR